MKISKNYGGGGKKQLILNIFLAFIAINKSNCFNEISYIGYFKIFDPETNKRFLTINYKFNTDNIIPLYNEIKKELKDKKINNDRNIDIKITTKETLNDNDKKNILNILHRIKEEFYKIFNKSKFRNILNSNLRENLKYKENYITCSLRYSSRMHKIFK